MGLDQYLSKRTYIGAHYAHRGVKCHIDVETKNGKIAIDPTRVDYISEHVAYWRKANQIHKWFVDNCQDGEDDCRDARVSREQLQELLDICKRIKAEAVTMETDIENGRTFKDGVWIPNMERGHVILNNNLCKELLPTTEGFFFGGTGYDQWYLDDIDDTINQLEPVLAEIPEDNYDVDFIYSSSW